MKKYISLNGDPLHKGKPRFASTYKVAKNKNKKMTFLGVSLLSFIRTSSHKQYQVYISEGLLIMTNNNKKFHKKFNQ